MVKKKGSGGRRDGAGRKPGLNEEEKFIAWHRYNLLVQSKSVNRLGTDFFGEENWNGSEGLKKDRDFISSIGSKSKNNKDKSRERINYLLSSDYVERRENIEFCLAGRALKYQSKDEGDVYRIFKINSKANGKLRDGELTQDKMYALVAKSMTEDPRINRKISARAVERAVKAEERRRRELPEQEIRDCIKALLD